VEGDKTIRVKVNARSYSLPVDASRTLLAFLREDLGLKGTKEGCGTGDCGSCIVIRDGNIINSCITLAVECNGSEITTIEGLSRGGEELHPIQKSFVSRGAVQCGYCTPGMILAAKDLLDKNPCPTREQIKVAISGNLCRCTGYKKIIDAIEAASEGGSLSPAEGGGSIGTSIPRSDALEHVTGTSCFGTDVNRPGMVYGKVLRSPYPHALIKRIDASRAEALEGVLAVVTGKEVPRGYFGVDIKDRLVFAREKVRYRGEEVAAVAAVTEDLAAKAAELIHIEYEPLESVMDPMEAMDENAPVIHEGLKEYDAGFDAQRKGNICSIANVRCGDIEKGFSESDMVREDHFATQIQHQASLEPHAVVAEVDIHGKITVWSSTQKPFAMRRYLSQSLDLPMNSIRVIATRIGGGFGGKLELIAEPFAVVLSMKCRRPVKIVYTREEEFLATTPRHKTYFWVKTGMRKDGTLLARHARFVYDTGSYSGNGPTTVTLSAQLVSGLYRIPNLFIEGYCVYTNKMNCGSMRGPSAPQTAFALESHTDNLAGMIGMDPLDFRLKNLLEPGETTGIGQTLVDVDYKEVIKKAAAKIGWSKLEKGQNIGRGLACVFWLSGGWSTSATVKINEDGTVGIITGAVDMGTGYLYGSVIQIVAEVLGVRPDKISLAQGDTDTTTYDHGTGGSRGTHTVGKVVQMAALKAKEELLREAAWMLEISVEDLETNDGWILPKGSPNKKLSFAEVSYSRHINRGGPVSGAAFYLPEMDAIDPARVKGLSFTAFRGVTMGCHAAVVRVHPETGHLEILKYAAAHDVGRAINPIGVEGQIEGGISMGLGFALTEKVILDDEGRILNPNLHDYRLPTALDVPETEPVIVEIPSRHGPFGAKGVGEPTMALTAAVLGNAIYDATGVRMNRTPMTPEDVYEEIKRQPAAKTPS